MLQYLIGIVLLAAACGHTTPAKSPEYMDTNLKRDDSQEIAYDNPNENVGFIFEDNREEHHDRVPPPTSSYKIQSKIAHK